MNISLMMADGYAYLWFSLYFVSVCKNQIKVKIIGRIQNEYSDLAAYITLYQLGDHDQSPPFDARPLILGPVERN